MGKTEHQKLKILYILELLYEQTDEKHAVRMRDIIAYLNQKGISAERKSIYRDLEMLQDFGVDILREQEYRGGYYIGSRDFELAELKLLVDAVQSSKFITQKKSRELIHKLEKLVSVYEAKQLQRQVVVTNRNKTINENIYYNIDMIYNGISGDVKIRFQYFSWNIEKEMELRRDGAFYEVSPLVLSWDDENYYLIAYDEEDKIIKHFRVDKMIKISLTRKKREGLKQFETFDIASYSKKTFGMFAGEEETVILLCENDMIGVVIDRFGQEVNVRKVDDMHFRARLHVAVSGQFYGWLCGLGEKVEIIEPAEMREKYVTYLQKIQNKYS